MQNSKRGSFDLEERTYTFAHNVRAYCKGLKLTAFNIDDVKQVIRSSGSIAANYIEANESLSKKDFVMRLKISRKEAKETVLWLKLLKAPDALQQEAIELKKILSAILEKSK
jgi:four helix bundle protein